MNNFEFELEMTKIKSLNRILKSGTEMKLKLINEIYFEQNKLNFMFITVYLLRILLKTVGFCTKQ